MNRRLLRFAAVVGVLCVGVAGAMWALANDDDAPGAPRAGEGVAASASPTPTPIPVVFEVIENFGMPLPGRSLEQRPESVFPPWQGSNAVIYDTRTGQAIDLGPGGTVSFSPDGQYAAWIVGDRAALPPGSFLSGEARIVTLATGEQRVIGHGAAVGFPDTDRLALQLPRQPLENAQWKLFDIDTLQPSADQTTGGQTAGERVTSTGHILRVTPKPGTDLPRGGYGTSHFELLDPSDRHLVLEFDAYKVVDATTTELVVASAWTEIPTEPFTSQPVFLHYLDVTTGQGTLFAFAEASSPNWPLSANDKNVLWTDSFCGPEDQTQVMIVDRLSGMPFGLIRVSPDANIDRPQPGSDDAYMLLTPSGLIAEGTFGAEALIDPVTMKYVSALPPVQLTPELQDKGPVQPTWSNDYRYAAYWQGGGHGGLC